MATANYGPLGPANSLDEYQARERALAKAPPAMRLAVGDAVKDAQEIAATISALRAQEHALEDEIAAKQNHLRVLTVAIRHLEISLVRAEARRATLIHELGRLPSSSTPEQPADATVESASVPRQPT